MESNQLALLSKPPALVLPLTTAELTDIQKGWLVMSGLREFTFAHLQAGELAVQLLLNNHAAHTKETLPQLQEDIKKASALITEKKEMRLAFTNKLKEKIIDPAMLYEKREEELLKAANLTEFNLRKLVETDNKATNNKLLEKQNYEAHIKNEYMRIATKYRITLSNLITFYYTGALKQKEMSKKDLGVYLQDIKNELPHIELEKPTKFEAVLLSVDERRAIYNSIPAYSPAPDLQKAVEAVDVAFSMYDQDIKNAEAAIASVEQTTANNTAAAIQELEVESSTNTLVAAAGNMQIASTSGTTIKRKQVIIEENTSEWAVAVLAAFIKNIGRCKIKTATFSKLTVGQMATALSALLTDDNPPVLTGLKTKVDEK